MNKEKEDDKLVSECIERRVLFLQTGGKNRINKATLNFLAQQELFLRREEKLAEKFSKRGFIPTYRGKKAKYTERHLNLMLSDLHYGANLDAGLVRYPYGPTEESRRTASIGAQVSDYKRQYRKETCLNVHLLGDIIQGKLHDVQDGAILTEQIDRALHHLIHLFEFLATEFPKIVIRTSVGNHGRDCARHADRVMQGKHDSVEFRIYRAIKWAMKKVINVEVETPIRSFYVVDSFGMKSMYTHGDGVINPGFPGRSINIGKMKSQANDFCLSHPQYADIQLFGVGHVHTASDVQAGNHTFVTNGCLIPGDEYAQTIGLFQTKSCQQLFETVDGHLFGDHRRLEVGPAQDKDSSLDKIIPLWQGLEG